jgi:hypothetical protein
MQNVPPAPRMSILRYLIESGGEIGFLLVVLSLFLILWGLINLLFVKNRAVLAAQALLSLAPAAFTCAGLIHLFIKAHAMMTTPGPVEPIVIANLISHSLVLGIVGTGSTTIPAFLGILALTKNLGRRVKT